MKHKFAHRFNADGSVDAICRSCFRTIATADGEAALSTSENQHICDPMDLLHFYLEATHVPSPTLPKVDA